MSSQIKANTYSNIQRRSCMKKFESKLKMGSHWVHEIAMRKSILHPNLLPVLDIEFNKDAIGFLYPLCLMDVSEYMDTCKKNSSFRVYPPKEVLYLEHEKCTLVLDLLEVMHFFETQKLVHLRICPDRLFLTFFPIRCVLSDFGLSCRNSFAEHDLSPCPESLFAGSQVSSLQLDLFSMDIWCMNRVWWSLLFLQDPVDLIAKHILKLPNAVSSSDVFSFVIEWLYFFFGENIVLLYQRQALPEHNKERSLTYGMQWPISSAFDPSISHETRIKDMSKVIEQTTPLATWTQTFLIKQIFGFLCQLLNPNPQQRLNFWKEHAHFFEQSLLKLKGCLVTLPLTSSASSTFNPAEFVRSPSHELSSQDELEKLLEWLQTQHTPNENGNGNENGGMLTKLLWKSKEFLLRHSSSFDVVSIYTSCRLVFEAYLEKDLFEAVFSPCKQIAITQKYRIEELETKWIHFIDLL